MEFMPEKYLVTAGGKIKCVRCKAFIKKHQRQCLHPAIKNKSCCKWHGGMSSGPKTKEGIERIRQAHLKTGNETLAVRQERSKNIAGLQMIEDALHLLGISSAPRSPGPRANGHIRITSLDEIKKVLK
jgi:hypothetical protein